MKQRPSVEWFANTGTKPSLWRLLLGFVAVVLLYGAARLSIPFWVDRDYPWLAPSLFFTCQMVLLYMFQRSILHGEPVWWRVGPRCLTLFRTASWRNYPWGSIEQVEDLDDTAVLHTTRGRVALGRTTYNWRRLADAVREHIGQPVEPAVEDTREVTIPPATVETWLHLDPGEVLELKRHGRRYMLYVAAAVLAATGIVAWFSALALAGAGWAPLAIIVLGFGASVWSNHRAAKRRPMAVALMQIQASGEALRLRYPSGWRTIPWGSLLSVRKIPLTVIVGSLGGDFALAAWVDRRRLLPAIEQAIAARRAGEVLPRVTGVDVPEAALSRAATDAAVAERGVSRTDPGGIGVPPMGS